MSLFRFTIFVTVITTIWGILLGFISWRIIQITPPNFHILIGITAVISWLAHPIAFSTRFWKDHPQK